ncbi:MAG: hypothetical protein ACI4LX_10910 [Treponema sp.]
MTEIKLDNIPYLIESKEMSVQEACIQVYRILYMNPARFNLQDLDEDTRSDFLLYFLQYKAEKIVNTFNPEIALFGSYIFFTIQLAKITYIKAMTRKKNFEKTYFKDSVHNFYDMQEYAEKSVTKIADKIPSYVPSKTQGQIPHLVYRRLLEKQPHRLSTKDSQERKLKIGVLLLALKSAWYINDEQINKVSQICEIPADVLTDSVCTLKAKLINKSLNRKKIEEARNRAYYFVNDYKMRLAKGEDSVSETSFKIFKKRLSYHTNSWKVKTKNLQSGMARISPTNSEIAAVLGSNDRWVSIYLAKIKNMNLENRGISDFIS